MLHRIVSKYLIKHVIAEFNMTLVLIHSLSNGRYTFSTDPLLTFEQTSYSLAEANSNVTFDLQISRHVQSSLTLSIQLREVAGGTAGAGDYSLPTDVFLFRPEDDNITVPIIITGDDRVELTEELLIQMMPASSVSFSTEPSVISIFIEDDDGGM